MKIKRKKRTIQKLEWIIILLNEWWVKPFHRLMISGPGAGRELFESSIPLFRFQLNSRFPGFPADFTQDFQDFRCLCDLYTLEVAPSFGLGHTNMIHVTI